MSAEPNLPHGRLWYVWCVVGGLLTLAFFCLTLLLNPASSVSDTEFRDAQRVIARQVDGELSSVITSLASDLSYGYLQGRRPDMEVASFAVAFFATFVLPFAWMLVGCPLLHLLLKIGGAPGGWRATWQSFGIYRLACDGATLAVVLAVLLTDMRPVYVASLLAITLPLIRLLSMTGLWVVLGVYHKFGPVRFVLMALPSILIGTALSGAIAFVLAMYYYAFMVSSSVSTSVS